MAEDLMREARERFQIAYDAEADNRMQAEEDLRFAALEQWDEQTRAQRLADGRPTLVMDRLGQVVRQITGDARLNPPGIKVRPVDDGADPDVAETLNGLIRNIESASTAETHYISAIESAARCGMGFLRVDYDYTDDSSFDMELRIKSIRSPFAVLFDPFAEDPTRADAEFCFVSEVMPEKVYRQKFPKAPMADWDGAQGLVDGSSWREGNGVRIAEYWTRKMRRRKLLMLGDMRVVDITDMDAAEVQQLAQTVGVVRERTADVPHVTMRVINGVEQLGEVYEWPGRYMPVVPVWGEMVEMGGRTVRRGIIRAGRDAQIRYNATVNAVTEYTMTMNKGKRILTPDQIEGHEGDWARAHLSSRAYLLLNAPENPNVPHGGVPIQSDPPPAGLLADVQLAAQDIEAATGIYRENLGRESNAISGRAILSRQREGDVGSFLYIDNLARAVSQIGRILVDTIPRVYDTPRKVRILGEDGKTDFAAVNTWDPQTGRIINDLSQGRYDVVASTGPSFSTRREEGREFIMAAVQANPAVLDMGGDLLMGMMDAPGADELAKRFRKRAVAAGMAEPEEGDPPPPPAQPDPNMLLAQAEMAKAQVAGQKAQADAQIKQAEAQIEAARAQAQAQVEAARLQLEAERVELERARLELERAKAVAEARNKSRGTDLKAAETQAKLIEQAMQRQAAPVQIALGPEMEKASVAGTQVAAASMDRAAASMEALAQGVGAMAQATQAMAGEVVRAVTAPKRLVRDPKTGRAAGVESVL